MNGAGNAIVATGVRKSFGDHVVLHDIGLEVAEGTIFALLGPNGAGKTTLVQILSTLITPDRGAVQIAGHDLADDPDAIRRSIGVTGQFSALDSLLTGRENLMLMADLWHLDRAEGRRRTDALLEQFDLGDAADAIAMTYSGGMQRRLDLAMTLVGDPKVIFLDEPTTGLDPRSRRVMWGIVRDLVGLGVTFLLTTQHMDEADALAHHIAVLDQGVIVADGTPDELKRKIPGGHVTLQFSEPDNLRAAAEALGTTAVVDSERLIVQVPNDGSSESLRALLQQLSSAAVDVPSLSTHSPDLDDVFLALTGRPTTAIEEVQP